MSNVNTNDETNINNNIENVDQNKLPALKNRFIINKIIDIIKNKGNKNKLIKISNMRLLNQNNFLLFE